MWFAIAIFAAISIGSLITGLYAAFRKPEGSGQEDSSLSGPTSSYGESLPVIFGTMQVESPRIICASNFFASRVLSGDPDTWSGSTISDSIAGEPAYSDQQRAAIQYAGAMDLVLSQRIFKDGAPISTVTLRRIWLGDNLLWSGDKFTTKVTFSTNLLDCDPNVNGPGPGVGVKYPGGVDGSAGVGFGGSSSTAGSSAWWFGGYETGSGDGDATNLIGSYLYTWDQWWNGSRWTRGQGLERVRFYCGNGNETPEPFFAVGNFSFPYSYPAYSTLVRLVFADFFFGMGPNVRQVTAEITQSCPAPEIGDVSGLMANQKDVNAISVLYQLLTNPMFAGSPKVPAVDVVSFAAARAACTDLYFSYRLNNRIKVGALIDQILQHVDGVLYQEPTNGTIRIALNRPLTTGSLPKFTADDMVDGPSIEKTSWDATISQARVTFTMRDLASNGMSAQSVAIAKDPGLAAQNQIVDTLDDSLDTVFEPGTANALAARKLAIANTPLLKATIPFKRTAAAMALRPLGGFVFDYAPLGIVNAQMRVVSIDTGNLDSNVVTVTAVQDRFVPPPIVAAPKPPKNVPVVPPRPTVQITKSRMITAPYPFARLGIGDARKVLTTAARRGQYGAGSGFNYDRFLMLAKRPYPAATKFNWKLSDTYELTSKTQTCNYTPCGRLGTTIPSQDAKGTGIYTGGFVVDGVEQYALDRLSTTLVQNGRNIMLIDDEFIVIENFTRLTSTSIAVTKAHRMAWDSVPATSGPDWIPSHAVNADVWFFDFRFPAEIQSCLSDPYVSNDFVPNTTIQTLSNDPLARRYGAGFGNGKYVYEVSNVDPMRSNVKTTSGAHFLADRANVMLPPRRVYRGGPGSYPSSISVPAASTSFQWTMSTPISTGVYCQRSGQPREGAAFWLPYDTDSALVDFDEETSPVVTGATYTSDTTPANSSPFGDGCFAIQVWYRIPGTAFASLQATTFSGSSNASSHVIACPAESTTRTVELFVARCYRHLFSGAVYQLGQTRSFQIQITRP